MNPSSRLDTTATRAREIVARGFRGVPRHWQPATERLDDLKACETAGRLEHGRLSGVAVVLLLGVGAMTYASVSRGELSGVPLACVVLAGVCVAAAPIVYRRFFLLRLELDPQNARLTVFRGRTRAASVPLDAVRIARVAGFPLRDAVWVEIAGDVAAGRLAILVARR